MGTDYNTISNASTFNISIPAGNYDGSDATSVFTIPFTVINNNVPQGVRTIVFTIQPSSSFFASSTTTCGGSPTIASSYTIYDDDFVSGKVWDDADNSANNTFININTGSETGTNTGGLLNAILVDSNNKVLKTTPVAADGTYTFLDVPLNQSNVKIILSTTAGTVGNTALRHPSHLTGSTLVHSRQLLLILLQTSLVRTLELSSCPILIMSMELQQQIQGEPILYKFQHYLAPTRKMGTLVLATVSRLLVCQLMGRCTTTV